jgi:hypothetical protein
MATQVTPEGTTVSAGISASKMALILHSANSAYSILEIAQALYSSYPLLTAPKMIRVLTAPEMFPSLGRVELISLLLEVGYTQADTLNAVTAQFPFILTGYTTLTGTLGTTSTDTVLTYGRASVTYGRSSMTYGHAAYWYSQSSGPDVSVQSGIFFIGNPSTSHFIITGQYKEDLFPDRDDLKQQIICLMAYVLQYPYPPTVSKTH